MLQKSLLNKTRVAICAIFKDEGPYILEWIAHHRLIGITDFYIADNISADGSSELLELLHSEREITRISWPTEPGIKPQLPAYQHMAELAKNDNIDWALFIDADEFVILEEDVKDIQSAIIKITAGNDSISGIAINWATYGSSHLIINPDYSILDNFEFRFKKDSNINKHYKSLIKIADFLSSGSTPHEFKIKDTKKYVDTAGVELPQPLSGMSTCVTWGCMKIHHYMIKSKIEYVTKKMKKGRASSSTALDMSYFNAHDVNSEYSPMKESWVKKVKFIKNEMLTSYPGKYSEHSNPLYYINDRKHIGAIDSLKNINNSLIEVTGWALAQDGRPPLSFRVIANEHIELFIHNLTFKRRPDVFKAIEFCNDEHCGFAISCDIPQNKEISSISVYFGNEPIVSTGLITFQK